MIQAERYVHNESFAYAVGAFYLEFADLLIDRRPFRLKYLTDLSKLPDYENSYGRILERQEIYDAPVDPGGSPLFYKLPDSFASAINDGERWRWCLKQAERASPQVAIEVKFRLANFASASFG